MPGHIALASARMECLEGRIGMAGTDQSPSTEKSAKNYTLGIRLYLYASPPSAASAASFAMSGLDQAARDARCANDRLGFLRRTFNTGFTQ